MGKIIVIEHTNILGFKIKRILLENGFSNVEIIKEYRSILKNEHLHNPDCIIIDLDDKNNDMIQLIKKIKNEKVTEKSSIISISGDADLHNLKRAISVGCVDFILKPFETETLINKVHRLYYTDDKYIVSTTKYKTGELYKKNAITINWTDDYEMGFDLIDSEHRQIIENYNKLYTMMKDGQGHEYCHELIKFLNAYVNTHFEHEEQIQLEVSFDEYQEHKEHHNYFKNQVIEMIEKYKNKDITNADLISINLFIKDWLLHHILIDDMKIREFIKENNIRSYLTI